MLVDFFICADRVDLLVRRSNPLVTFVLSVICGGKFLWICTAVFDVSLTAILAILCDGTCFIRGDTSKAVEV